MLRKIIASEALTTAELLEREGRDYTFLNPVSYLQARRCPELYRLFDAIFADGQLLAAAITLLYGKRITRRSFDLTSLAHSLFTYALTHRRSIYIVGATQVQADTAVAHLRQRYPTLIIAGHRSGYFANDTEHEAEAQHIARLNPHFLIVGMGARRQERFVIQVRQAGYRGTAFTCGAFIAQTALHRAPYYPRWVDRLHLRALYRFVREPHTRRRYLRAFFLFPFTIIADRVRGAGSS